jgi:large subunit ribosomal protein L25
MKQQTLKATLRENKGSSYARRLRRNGFIPAVYYAEDKNNLHLELSSNELEKAVSGKNGLNTLLKLSVEGKGDFDVLIGDYQADPIKRNFLHADFKPVNVNEKVKVLIPLEFVGKAKGVKAGGTLDVARRNLEIYCLPGNIPTKIEIDVTNLNQGDNLHLEDIDLPEGSEIKEAVNFTIASIQQPKGVEELLAESAEVEEEAKANAAQEGGDAEAPKEESTEDKKENSDG